MLRSFKFNYVVIPAIAILFSLLIHWIIYQDFAWYQALNKPSLAARPIFFMIMCFLTTASVTIASSVIWNKMPRTKQFYSILWQTAGVALLLLGHISAMFHFHNIKLAVVLNALMCFWLICLTYYLTRQSIFIGLLIVPYIAWSLFLCFLNYSIFQLNG